MFVFSNSAFVAVIVVFPCFSNLARKRIGVDLVECAGWKDMGEIKNGEKLTRKKCVMKDIYFQYKKKIKVSKHLNDMEKIIGINKVCISQCDGCIILKYVLIIKDNLYEFKCLLILHQEKYFFMILCRH